MNPSKLRGLTSGVTAIAAGQYHGLAVQNDVVFVWGYNGGQLETQDLPRIDAAFPSLTMKRPLALP